MTKQPTAKPQRYHLEEKLLRRLEPPPKGSRIFYDGGVAGFGFRVTCRGVCAFILNYYAPSGRERRLTIGRWPVWSAAAAREEAKQIRRRIDRGEDPLEDRQQRRAAETFGELAAEFLAQHSAEKKSGAQDKRYMEADVLPHWRHVKLRDIARRDVLRLVEGKSKTAPIAANRILALVRTMFNWAVSRDLVASNPCLQVKPPGREVSRDRVLSLDEVAQFWAGFTEGPAVNAGVVDAARLVLATAQRPGEVCAMEWAAVDLAGRWWTIPAERAKNGLAHRVPLNDVAIEILRARRAAAAPSSSSPKAKHPRERWVFRSPRGEGYMAPGRIALALRRSRALQRSKDPSERGRDAGAGEFTPHDLRRTAASQMAGAGVSRMVVGQVLNHVERGVTKISDRHSYDAEKRRALDLWGRVLASAIGRPVRADVVELAR